MIADPLASLERLAATDPTATTLARLHLLALRAADDPAWADGVPDLGSPRSDAAPLLQGVTLRIDVDRTRGLVRQLAAVVDQTRVAEDAKLGDRLASADVDPLALIQASVTQQAAELEAIAVRIGFDGPVLAVVAHAATLPLLVAWGRRAANLVDGPARSRGYCPLCAAWPTLAEVRGLSRDLFLHCGRCGTGWRFEHDRCPFCEERAAGARTYFAAEEERESRRAVTCDGCRGYIKTQTTLGPPGVADLLLHDLESLELDVVAVEHGYSRPDEPGWPLSIRIESMPDRGRSSWRRWWR